jgi:hypothetical protein
MTRRKTKRELASAVENLEDLHTGREYPKAGLSTLLSYEWETVDADRRLIRLETGEVKQILPGVLGKVAPSDHSRERDPR